MNAAFENFRVGLTKQMIASGADPKDVASTEAIFIATHNFLASENFVSGAPTPGMESLRTIPTLISSGQGAYENIRLDALSEFLDTCKVPAETKGSCAMEVARILTGGCSDPSYFVDEGRPSKKTLPLGQVYGPDTIALLNLDKGKALESFGEYSDRVTSDSRLAVTLAVLRSHKSLIDRALPRKAAEDPVVLIKIPSPEVYSLEMSQSPNAATRTSANRQPLIDLHRDPSAVDTTPQRIVVKKANDTGTPPVLQADGIVYAGLKANLFDLTLDANTTGYQAVDWTDLVAEGGAVGSVVVQVTYDDAGDITREEFTLETRYLRQAQFTTLTNVQDSGDRGANIRSKWTFNSFSRVSGGSLPNGNPIVPGTASSVLSTFSGVELVLEVTFNANLNIKNAFVDGNGTIAASLAGATIPAPVQTAFGKMKFEVIAWSPYLFFSEENMRKTTAAVRMNWKELEFLIPPGRNYIVDYSLMGQELGADVTATTSEVINLGNSWRSVNIIANTITGVYNRLQVEGQNPVQDYYTSVAADYAAGTLSKPHCITWQIDVSQASVMRESERLADLHNYVTSRLLALLADGHNRSMYTENFEPGERARYKVITSGPICEILFGITNYWNALDDKTAVAEGSSYSLKLPNGTQLDVIKSHFTFFNDKMLVFPVRDAKPDDVTSFATILDRGTFVGQYTPVANGAANKRVVANSREIVFPTNPLGYIIEVAGLDTELAVMTDYANYYDLANN